MLRLGVVSDVHWCPDPERVVVWHHRLDFAGVPALLAASLEHLAGEVVDAVVLLGDLSNDGDKPSLDAVLGSCARSWSGPLFAVAGNHDAVAELPGAVRRIEGEVPLAALPIELDAAGKLCAAPSSFDPSGALVLATHYPLLSQEELFAERGFKYAGRLRGADDVLDRLRARNAPTVVLCGHVHGRESRADGTVLQLTAGALVEPPHECSVIEIDAADGRLEVRRASHRLCEPAVDDEPVFVPDRETWSFASGSWSRR